MVSLENFDSWNLTYKHKSILRHIDGRCRFIIALGRRWVNAMLHKKQAYLMRNFHHRAAMD